METTNNEKEITLSYLLKVLKRSAIWLIIAAVVLGTLAALYTAIIVKPVYRAKTQFWVTNTTSNVDYTSSAQMGAAVTISSSCVELAYQDLPARNAVMHNDNALAKTLGFCSVDENGNQVVTRENIDSCVAYVRRMIGAGKANEEGLIFYVTVTAPTPEEAFAVSTALQAVFPDTVFSLVGVMDNEQNADMLTAITPVYSVNDVATVKDSPVKAFVLAALVAAIVVYVIFFIMSLMDTVVYTEQALKDSFKHPVVGTIPNWSNGNPQNVKANKLLKNSKKYKHSDLVLRDYTDRLLSAKSPFAVTEAFNTLRTNIIFSLAAAKNPVIAVTSARSAEGKSLMSSNTAISLSLLEKKVLLVECDMRCPSFSKVFSRKVSEGLSELLAGMVDKTEDVVQTYDENLDIIFCGKIPPNPSELLSSERMHELVAEWREKYDYIVLDMPPVCEVADAGVISSMVSGYVLTVRCDFSDINEVRAAAAGLEAVNGNILGFILNDINLKARGEYKNDYHKLYRKTAASSQTEE